LLPCNDLAPLSECLISPSLRRFAGPFDLVHEKLAQCLFQFSHLGANFERAAVDEPARSTANFVSLRAAA